MHDLDEGKTVIILGVDPPEGLDKLFFQCVFIVVNFVRNWQGLLFWVIEKACYGCGWCVAVKKTLEDLACIENHDFFVFVFWQDVWFAVVVNDLFCEFWSLLDDHEGNGLVCSVGFVFLLHELLELRFSVAQGLNSGCDFFFDVGVEVNFHDVRDKADQADFLVVGFEEGFETVVMGSWDGEGYVDVEFVAFGDDFFELIDEFERVAEFGGRAGEPEEGVDNFLPLAVLHDGGSGSFLEIDWHFGEEFKYRTV